MHYFYTVVATVIVTSSTSGYETEHVHAALTANSTNKGHTHCSKVVNLFNIFHPKIPFFFYFCRTCTRLAAIKSSLARLRGVERDHVTVPWPNAEVVGISAATTKHRRRENANIKPLYPLLYLYLPSCQLSHGRTCQSIFGGRSRAAAIFQRVRKQPFTLNGRPMLA